MPEKELGVWSLEFGVANFWSYRFLSKKPCISIEVQGFYFQKMIKILRGQVLQLLTPNSQLLTLPSLRLVLWRLQNEQRQALS